MWVGVGALFEQLGRKNRVTKRTVQSSACGARCLILDSSARTGDTRRNHHD
jgi:hypothetical protein